jgi:hypothetical protein
MTTCRIRIPIQHRTVGLSARVRRRPSALPLAALFLLPACRDAPPASSVTPARARFGDQVEQLLAGSRRALGGEAVAAVRDITSRATVTGPAGEFETVVYADREGRARMKQSSGFDAIVDSLTARATDDQGHWTEADAEVHAVVRGHELHMLALDPRRMFDTAVAGPLVPFGGVEHLSIRFADRQGRQITVYYGAEDTVPAGTRVGWTDPPVVVTFDRWENFEGVRVFREANFRQGAETFRYRFDEIRLNTLTTDSFVVR